MSGSDRSTSRCCVCGFPEVRTDEVADGGVLYLGWCPRCDHRFTSRAPGLRPVPLQRTPEDHVRAA